MAFYGSKSSASFVCSQSLRLHHISHGKQLFLKMYEKCAKSIVCRRDKEEELTTKKSVALMTLLKTHMRQDSKELMKRAKDKETSKHEMSLGSAFTLMCSDHLRAHCYFR